MGSHFVHIKTVQHFSNLILFMDESCLNGCTFERGHPVRKWKKWYPIEYYFYCTLIAVLECPEYGRLRPKHIAKYNLILIIISWLIYFVYWRCILYYTEMHINFLKQSLPWINCHEYSKYSGEFVCLDFIWFSVKYFKILHIWWKAD